MWKYKLKEYLNTSLEFVSNEKYKINKVRWVGDSKNDRINLEGYILKNDMSLMRFIFNNNSNKNREFEIELERTIESRKEQITCKRIKLIEFNIKSSNLAGMSEISFCFKVDNQNRISNSEAPIINVVRKYMKISRGRFNI